MDKVSFSPGSPFEKYRLEEEVGQGATGKVFRGVQIDNGKEVAIKQIWDLNGISEIVALKDIKHHPNIVAFIEAFFAENKILIVMEYMAGGTLSSLYTEVSMEEDEIATVCREVLKALAFLHEKGIIHADVKGENILLGTNGEVKLADFSSSIRTSDHTPPGIDVRCFGKVALEMANGEYEACSLAFKDFLDRTEEDLDQRLTAADLLEHDFLKLAQPVETLKPLILAAKTNHEI